MGFGAEVCSVSISVVLNGMSYEGRRREQRGMASEGEEEKWDGMKATLFVISKRERVWRSAHDGMIPRQVDKSSQRVHDNIQSTPHDTPRS